MVAEVNIDVDVDVDVDVEVELFVDSDLEVDVDADANLNVDVDVDVEVNFDAFGYTCQNPMSMSPSRALKQLAKSKQNMSWCVEDHHSECLILYLCYQCLSCFCTTVILS